MSSATPIAYPTWNVPKDILGCFFECPICKSWNQHSANFSGVFFGTTRMCDMCGVNYVLMPFSEKKC